MKFLRGRERSRSPLRGHRERRWCITIFNIRHRNGGQSSVPWTCIARKFACISRFSSRETSPPRSRASARNCSAIQRYQRGATGISILHRHGGPRLKLSAIFPADRCSPSPLANYRRPFLSIDSETSPPTSTPKVP